ncbi:BTB/POZ and MATH domain-containing 2 -like protein [Carex littledalei]|uniref:BTB/POZ and MATH domain-containing 2 -like protein n=1 Tax=Carex littledalei TaxID=544730 RepID=A0A833VZ07_9POAL|nr:BTB/POZ and MATH domain-containing 2 -like protein [Carex littledalei]
MSSLLVNIFLFLSWGHDVNTKGISLSLELNTTSVSKIVTADYEMGLLNKYGRPTAESWIKSTDTFYWDGGFCHGNLMKRSDLELNYISDDFLIIFCSISVIHKPHEMLQNCSIGASPFCLTENLGALLERQEETDVTYKVEGENISAHRLVLASRSTVFKAGLCGHMLERNCKEIEINEMNALVFRVMIRFMYTDSLPDMDDLMSGGYFYQHLIAAADRFQLEGLKILCEARLCMIVSVNTVVSSLVVAERHKCDYLKKKCIEFIAKPENFGSVSVTEEYATLSSFPSLVEEILGEKLKFE